MWCFDKNAIAQNTFAVFCILVVLLILSWTIVQFSQIWLDNLFYKTLGFCVTSTMDSFIVFVIIMAAFLIVVWLISKYVLPGTHNMLLGLEEQNVEKTVNVEAGGLGVSTTTTASTTTSTTSEPLATKTVGMNIGFGGPSSSLYPVGRRPN